MVAVQQHAQLQRVAVSGVVQIVAERVDGLDLSAWYHQPLEPGDPAGNVNLSYGQTGRQGVAWTNQVALGKSARAEVGAAE